MEKDYLQIFNVGLADELKKMNDDQLWKFIQSEDARIKEWIDTGNLPRTGVFYAYRGGPEHYRKHFLGEIERYRDGVIYTMILDFCFGQEKVFAGYQARSGFLDSAESCRVTTSEVIMPFIGDDEEDVYFREIYFHLLETRHLDDIIRAMTAHADDLIDNFPSDIAEIKRMRELCLSDQDYKVAFIYDIIAY